jgi:hypothetical protein
MKPRALPLLLIGLILLGLLILTGCIMSRDVRLPAPPPVRYQATTAPVGVVNGQIVYPNE